MESVTFSEAQEVLDAAFAKATEIGTPMSVAIVDIGRSLLAFGRQDDAKLGSIDVAIGKAYTSRSLDMNTEDVGPLTQPGAPLFGLQATNPLVIGFGGGRPLSRGGVVVGAVGVSGGSVEQDQEVAAAAVDAFTG
ncbi:MAG: heme-binding protein [Acidimicrobiia bacterium]|nr:heme-binding protein [Acidimicrobiia bacterium]